MSETTNIAWADSTAERRILASCRVRVDADGRIYWTRNGRRAEHKTPLGYLQVRVMIAGKRLHVGAHRIVWTYFHGPVTAGLVINHRNGIKADNRPENLEECTYSENTKHAHRTGLKNQRGEKNPAAKLTSAQVAAIRATYAAGGVSQAALGELYRVSFKTISKIVRGERRNADGAGPTADYVERRSSRVRDRAGADPSEWPEDLRVRETPR